MVTKEKLATPAPMSPSPCLSLLDTRLRASLWVTAILLFSGTTHLFLLGILGASWEGALSLRKPALFGISGGLTTFSIAWLMTQLRPQKYDSAMSNSIAVALLIEVALITMQYWRGVASHFNHSTGFNALCEFTMLGLILAVTAAVIYLSFRTTRLREIEPAMALAIQGGMWLLALSCVLGVLTTALGELNIALGRPHELWGKAGVLKFPHGVALHAIQFLPLAAWTLIRLKMPNAHRMVLLLLSSQVLFLLYAVWQTSRGLARFDWDSVGGILLAISAVLGVLPVVAIIKAGLHNSLHKVRV